jgi:chromosome segregation ATPase
MTEADNALMLAIPRELRAELRQHRTMLLQLVDATRRHDRRFEEIEQRFGQIEGRISDMRAEIELMLKAELFGRLTHFETQMDERLAQLSDRLSAVERREG